MMGVEKHAAREGKKYHFQKGGGVNFVFGPKYRPLRNVQVDWQSSTVKKFPRSYTVYIDEDCTVRTGAFSSAARGLPTTVFTDVMYRINVRTLKVTQCSFYGGP